MKPILTNIVLFLFPQILLSQIAADSAYLFEETKDDFYEFHWQGSIEISRDSTFYNLSCGDRIDSIELIDASKKIVWQSTDVESTRTIPAEIVREKSYSIRIYEELGVTEFIWFP